MNKSIIGGIAVIGVLLVGVIFVYERISVKRVDLSRAGKQVGTLSPDTKKEASVVTLDSDIQYESTYGAIALERLLPMAEYANVLRISKKERPQCLLVSSDYFVNGKMDLLRSMLAYENTVDIQPEIEESKVYVEYPSKLVSRLLREVDEFSARTYISDFSTIGLCRLSDTLITIAGQSYDADILKGEKVERRHDRLLLWNNGKIVEMQTLVIANRTATGGDVTACTASLKDENILWKCFDGFEGDETGITGNRMSTFIFDMNGKVISTEPSVEPFPVP